MWEYVPISRSLKGSPVLPPFPWSVGTYVAAAWHWQELGRGGRTHCQHHLPHRPVPRRCEGPRGAADGGLLGSLGLVVSSF